MKKLLLLSVIAILFSCKKEHVIITNKKASNTLEYGVKLSQKTDFTFRYYDNGFVCDTVINSDYYYKKITIDEADPHFHLVARILDKSSFKTNIKTWFIMNNDTIAVDTSSYFVSGFGKIVK